MSTEAPPTASSAGSCLQDRNFRSQENRWGCFQCRRRRQTAAERDIAAAAAAAAENWPSPCR